MYIIRIQVHKGKDDVYEFIVTNHEELKTSVVTPLFVTKRFSKGETSLFVEATDQTALANFILEKLADINGADNVHVIPLMRPQFFPVPPGTPDLSRFSVNISCIAPHYEDIHTAISGLKPTKDHVITYVAFTFMERGPDISMSVLARDMRSLEGWIEANISSLDGVVNTSLKEVTKTKQLATLVDLKKVVSPLTRWEYLTSREYGDEVYKDVVAGC
jgi:hypothetical protein